MNKLKKKKKKCWERPELIVLVRHQPEESVLSGCKGGSGGSVVSLSHHLMCHSDYGCTTSCREQSTS